MIAKKTLSRDRVAQIIAADIAPGSYVNLGLGIPTLVAKYLDASKEIILHSENGILGLEDLKAGQPIDTDLINASKGYVQLVPGSSICDQLLSFAMMRGGHLDATVLGAFQVSASGNIASWSTGDDGVPGIGGAMDLVAGAKRVIVAMEHTTRTGEPRLLEACTFPLTGKGVVNCIYTDMALIDVVPQRGFIVRAIAEGVSREQLQAATGAPLHFAEAVSLLN